MVVILSLPERAALPVVLFSGHEELPHSGSLRSCFPTPAILPGSTTPPDTCLDPALHSVHQRRPEPDAASATSAWTYRRWGHRHNRKWPSPQPASASADRRQSAAAAGMPHK